MSGQFSTPEVVAANRPLGQTGELLLLPRNAAVEEREVTGVAVSCANCVGACCLAGMALPLNAAEAEKLRQAGTDMRQMPRGEWQGNRPGWRRRFYQLLGGCAFQQDGRCMAYDTRPKVCQEVPVGEYTCLEARRRQGIGVS